MENIEKIKQLRKETGASIIECKKSLKEANGDVVGAKKILKKQGQSFVAQRTQRETKEGIIESYLHPNKKIGVLVELNCESDFVAKSENFQKLAHELCLQIAAMNPQKSSLLSQPWIKDETKTVKDLVSDYIIKMGENIVVKRFVRYEI